MSDLTPEERARRALAEVGYCPRIDPIYDEVAEDDAHILRFDSDAPPEFLWRSAAVAAGTEWTLGICWPCFADRLPGPCEHDPVDPMATSWPPVPR